MKVELGRTSNFRFFAPHLHSHLTRSSLIFGRLNSKSLISMQRPKNLWIKIELEIFLWNRTQMTKLNLGKKLNFFDPWSMLVYLIICFFMVSITCFVNYSWDFNTPFLMEYSKAFEKKYTKLGKGDRSSRSCVYSLVVVLTHIERRVFLWKFYTFLFEWHFQHSLSLSLPTLIIVVIVVINIPSQAKTINLRAARWFLTKWSTDVFICGFSTPRAYSVQ